jgi:hypothetical protein
MNIALTILIILCGLLAASAQQPSKVDEGPISLQLIRTRLIDSKALNESNDEANKRVIAEIKRRTVEFMLEESDRTYLKEAGATKKLLEAIDKSLPESKRQKALMLHDEIRIYSVIVANYNKKTLPELKIALEAAQEFVERFSSDSEAKDQLDWLRALIPSLKRRISIDRNSNSRYSSVN